MIQINCDLGEGIPDEESIFPLIDAASIACGGHFGDESSLRKSLISAKTSGIKVGAHPSYPDFENFGRKSLKIDFETLKKSLLNQINLFLKVAQSLELAMEHIKFHGALYNDAAANPELANSLCEFLKSKFPDTCLFVPPHSQTEKYAKKYGLKTRLEIFGDRAYQDNYQLLPRTKEKALFTKKEEIEKHLKPILEKGLIHSSSGKLLPVKAETLCFHGDNPGLIEFLPSIRKKYWK